MEPVSAGSAEARRERASERLLAGDPEAVLSVCGEVLAEIPEAVVGAPLGVAGYGGPMPGARSLRRVRASIPGVGSLQDKLILVDLAMRSRLAGVEVSGAVGLYVLDGRRISVDTAARTIEISPPR